MKLYLLYEVMVKYAQKISRKRLQFLKTDAGLRCSQQSYGYIKALIIIEMRLIY